MQSIWKSDDVDGTAICSRCSHRFIIGIPTVLYKELLPIAEGKEENLLEKLLEKISSKETYLLDIVPDEALLWMV